LNSLWCRTFYSNVTFFESIKISLAPKYSDCKLRHKINFYVTPLLPRKYVHGGKLLTSDKNPEIFSISIFFAKPTKCQILYKDPHFQRVKISGNILLMTFVGLGTHFGFSTYCSLTFIQLLASPIGLSVIVLQFYYRYYAIKE
jgi:hypothetical protein